MNPSKDYIRQWMQEKFLSVFSRKPNIEELTNDAIRGDAKSQFHLWELYAEGKYVDQNDAEAFVWLMAAAEHGHPKAQACLGAAYGLGEGGLQQSVTKALELWLSAARGGDPLSQFYLGWKSIPLDETEAFDWCRDEAEGGLDTAQYFLGAMYECGYGVPKNHHEAWKWWRKAAEKGEGVWAEMSIAALNNQRPA